MGKLGEAKPKKHIYTIYCIIYNISRAEFLRTAFQKLSTNHLNVLHPVYGIANCPSLPQHNFLLCTSCTLCPNKSNKSIELRCHDLKGEWVVVRWCRVVPIEYFSRKRRNV